jgi:hypothetical protein
MYSVAMNWKPNPPPISIIAPRFACTRLGERRIPSRTSGAAVRRSIAANDASSAPTAAREPIVRSDAQPASGASTTVKTRRSIEFTRVWERHDVQGVEGRTKRALHPLAGLLELDYTNLWVGQQVGTRIVAFTPSNERTRRRLEALYESLGAAA